METNFGREPGDLCAALTKTSESWRFFNSLKNLVLGKQLISFTFTVPQILKIDPYNADFKKEKIQRHITTSKMPPPTTLLRVDI